MLEFNIRVNFRKEITEKQKLLNNPKFELTADKLAKTLTRTNEALEELIKTHSVMENEEFKFSYIKKYKSNVSEAQSNLIVNFILFFKYT